MSTPLTKIDLSSVVEEVRASFKDQKLARQIGMGSALSELGEGDFIKMPEWWVRATGTMGIPFGKLVMLAGDSDSGKTSAAIEAMRAALEQGVGVIYVETEGKTTKNDLLAWGVDPTQILLVQSSIAENAFQGLFETWRAFKGKFPERRLLVVFDSIGNVVSQRDAEIDLTESDSKPGGKGKINRIGVNRMIAKRDEDQAAILLINYVYDQIGGHGKINAGGKAINFFSSLTFQTSRKRWLEKQVSGKKVRYGAEVVWKLYKNHLDKGNPGPKEVFLQITKNGIEFVGGGSSSGESEE